MARRHAVTSAPTPGAGAGDTVVGEDQEIDDMRDTTGSATPASAARPRADRRRTVRRVAAIGCGVVALLYLALLVLVADAEAGAAENTFGAYLFLTVPYAVGAGLLLVVDRRPLWAVGAAVQVLVLVLFVMFGAGLFGPGQGVLDYDVLSDLRMGWWATVITALEVLLLGALAYLALTPEDARPDAPA